MGPKEPHSTVLTPEEEAIIVAAREVASRPHRRNYYENVRNNVLTNPDRPL
jgi:hypothetical protein